MNKAKAISVSVILIIALSIGVYSLAKSNKVQLTKDISLDEIKDCVTNTWTETENVYGECKGSYDTKICDNPPLNTSCHVTKHDYTYSCIVESKPVQKNEEKCSDKKFAFEVNKLLGNKKYELNYGSQYKCDYSTMDDTVIIFCDSKYDGNGDGICQQGESCISFIITKQGITRMMKNSRKDFTENDDTFYQKLIDMEAKE